MDIDCKIRGGLPSIAVGTFLVLGACTVPAHMQITEGINPANQDKDVRFRTTYYFRTYDICENKPNVQLPRNDSLYRFRLTGKASSLFNDVHFESGSLDAAQIDPFGATVAYDDDNRSFYLKSPERVRRDALRNEQFDELERLIEAYGKVVSIVGDKNQESSEELQKIYLTQLEKALTNQLTEIDGPSLSSEEIRDVRLKQLFDSVRTHLHLKQGVKDAGKDVDGKLRPATSDNIIAMIEIVEDPDPGDPDPKERFKKQLTAIVDLSGSGDGEYCEGLRRGFQVLGPQGWQPYDQDSRLLFAMSSTGAPLISTLRELSGRILSSGSDPDIDHLTLLVRNELAAQDAKGKIEAFTYDPKQPDAADTLLAKTLTSLRGGKKP